MITEIRGDKMDEQKPLKLQYVDGAAFCQLESEIT